MRLRKTFLGNKNSDKCIVVLHGWGGNSLYLKIPLSPLFKYYSFLFYDYPADVLNPDPFSVLENFRKIKEDFLNEVNKLSQKQLVLFGTSLGAFLSTYLANTPFEDNPRKLILNTIGSSITETFWFGAATRKLKEETVKKGFTLEDFKSIWHEIEPKNNIPKKPYLKYLVFISKKDKVIPFYLCEEFLRLLEGKEAKIYFNKYLGHLSASFLNTFRIKKIKRFLEE